MCGLSEAMEGSSCEDSFISNLSMPTLQQLASVQVVLPFWHQYFSQLKAIKFSYYDRVDRYHRYVEDLSKQVESLKTPKSIQEVLTKSTYKIFQATVKWAKHFASYQSWITDSKEWHIEEANPAWCVWNCSGEIDYKKTAYNMLSSSELSGEQKFAILSAYCMEPEIINFDLGSLSTTSIEKVDMKKYSLVAYWLSTLKKKLHELAAGVTGSLDAKLARKCDNDLAFEYFWNRLGSADQIAVAKYRLKPPNENDDDYDFEYSYYCQRKLFSLMSWNQQRSLLAEMPDQIILNFWLEVRSPNLVRWAWKHSKDGMTVKQFARVVKEIFHQRNGYEDEMQLLIDLWDSAPDRLKMYAVKQMTNTIVKPSLFSKHLLITEYVGSCDEYSTTDSWEDAAIKTLRKENAMKFLCKFLSLKSAAERRQLMLSHAPEFAKNVRNPQVMIEPMSLCWPNPNEQVIFKNIVLNSPIMRKHCAEMLGCNGGFDEFKRTLAFYSTDANVAKEFTKQALLSGSVNRPRFFHDFSSWKELSDFIDESFVADPALATSLKKEFVASHASKFQLHSFETYKTDKDILSEMFKIIEHVYTPKELAAVKQRFLRAAKSEISNRSNYLQYFDKDRFVKLVSWCVATPKALEKYKKSFPVDDMYNRTINEINETYNNDSDFNDSLLFKLGDFLEWYFPDRDELKKWKLRKLEALDLEELTMFEYFLELDEQEDYLETLLSWFYHESVSDEIIAEFKAKIKEANKRPARTFTFKVPLF